MLDQLKFKTLAGLVALALALAFSNCKSAPKKTTPELSQLEGKKVALVTFDGESMARQIVEVALVNQLAQRGTFFLVSRQDVQEAQTYPDQDPNDWKTIAKRAGADVALRAKVLNFDAKLQEGYSTEEVEDSQWQKERGEKKRKNLYKVKALEGNVRIQLEFTNLASGETRIAVAEHQDKTLSDERGGAIHLKPKLSFLETLTNEALRKFFDTYR